MNFGVICEEPLDAQQLGAINRLSTRLDHAGPRFAAHLSLDGVDLVATPVGDNHALTAMWRWRGDAHAITIVGDDWWHVFVSLEQTMCEIFKVEDTEPPF